MNKYGILYIVGTPIGNLEDITLRALRTLKEVNLIACEDTRVTKKLLDHFEIKTPTISYFQHSKLSKIEHLINQLEQGKNIALVSDAGTPGISDPGQRLIAEIRNSNIETRNNNSTTEQSIDKSSWILGSSPRMTNGGEGINVIPIPGASALTAVASISGMIEKEFYFAGFIPKKKGRQTKLKQLSCLDCPIVIYESANRLERTLEDVRTYLGENTEVFIARESTKLFEEYWKNTVSNIQLDITKHILKGEVTLVVKQSKANS